MTDRHILTLSCPDRPGLVAAVVTLLAEHGGNIVDAQQYDDPATHRFFMRVVFALDGDVDALRQAFEAIATRHSMTWAMRPLNQKRRTLLMVSRFDHCLVDLLYRARIGELPMHVTGIVSNHPQSALNIGIEADVPFHHMAMTPATKTAQEAALRDLIEATETELVVLARYMQVLSHEMAGWLSGRCINIHHSFLPGFKGAKPYHQAYERGVKMIGATAHYVTDDLDEGPIIHQDVEAIGHGDTPDDLVRKGRDIERRVLSRAVQYHLQDRVLMNGGRTVVFRD